MSYVTQLSGEECTEVTFKLSLCSTLTSNGEAGAREEEEEEVDLECRMARARESGREINEFDEYSTLINDE